jgi:hypothetical protein
MRWSNVWMFDQDNSPVPTPRALVIPYQGVTTNYSMLPLMPDQDSFLDPLAPGLCYAPAGEGRHLSLDIKRYNTYDCGVCLRGLAF